MRFVPRLVLSTALLVGALSAALAQASQPAVWMWADDNDFRRGNLDGLALHPTMGLTAAPKLERTELDAEFVHCWVRDGAKIWLGTGLAGKVLQVENGKVKEIAKLDAPMVASLALDGQGGVYAGVVGSGEVVRVASDGKVEKLVKLESAHVWALVKKGGTLYAATGPGGKVYAIDVAAKTAKLWAETGADHVLTLVDGGDALYAGTADSALLVRIDGEKSARAIAAFPGAEVRSLVRSGKAWYAAVNGGQTAVPLASLKANPERAAAAPASKPVAAAKSSKDAQAKGKGAIWRRTDDGLVTRMYVSPEGMLSDIALIGNKVAAGAARGGRVVIGDEFGDVQTLFDVPEEEVLGLEVNAKGPVTLLTGKSASLYTVGGSSGDSIYTSEVLSETGIAVWGRVDVVGEGDLQVETRCGFTDPPGDTWSPWAAVKGGQVQSPPANFLQVRVRFATPTSRLSELRVHRQVANRAPQVTKIDAAVNKGKGNVSLSWTAEDADSDNLTFVVTYRPRGGRQWLNLHDRYYDKRTMELTPSDMPDGWYEVKVEVSDLPSNGPKAAKATARYSKSFLVDRSRPELTAQVVGRQLTGQAIDGLSRIVRVEASLDGEPAMLTAARDGVMDSLQEGFELELPAAVEKGAHTVLITAFDDAGNSGAIRVLVNQ